METSLVKSQANEEEEVGITDIDVESISQNEIESVQKIFKTMKRRRLERKFYGVDFLSTTSMKTSVVFLISLLIYFIGIVVKFFVERREETSGSVEEDSSFKQFLTKYINEEIIMILLTVFVIFSLRVVRPLLVVLMFELYWFCIVFFWNEFYNSFVTIMVCLLCLLIAVILTILSSSIFLFVIRHLPVLYFLSPVITSINESTKGVRRYNLQTKNLITRKVQSYTLEGRTEGSCVEGSIVWGDNENYGETLTGIWKNGQLVGPFESSIIGVRSLVKSVPIISYEAYNDRGIFTLVYSLISVECCYSGKMLYNLPSVTKVHERVCQCVGDCHCASEFFEEIGSDSEESSMDMVNVQFDHINKSIVLPGMSNVCEGNLEKISLRIKKRTDSKMRTITVSGIDTSDMKQCLIFLTGSIHKEQRQKEFAQFLALSKLPKSVTPVLVNLSQNGEMPDYNDSYLHVAFSNVLQSIILAQTKKINIFAMGDTIIFLFKAYYLFRTLLVENVQIENLMIVNPFDIPELLYNEHKRACISLFMNVKRITLYSNTFSVSAST
ncbi:hypothetical protein EIN_197670 [Entamoeba invadens IP1]|uniref:Uncharacterized protein n=1 Tax=Entamoeba invadens IP1 TaxID=370355 RepID=A0A0A1TUT2_ENTIV|nr:hypothetical protein EIN_197670 [Entamoeba invadens IP1]ELP83834.1 hypothetical protein EIN_197670 [Entamoeba invadens IP1]|eukprot:XP_004183180.1 hypothetical protein EIN_197670 [Entamoeba invadens IP1]